MDHINDISSNGFNIDSLIESKDDSENERVSLIFFVFFCV